jgi:hypothetical protein
MMKSKYLSWSDYRRRRAAYNRRWRVAAVPGTDLPPYPAGRTGMTQGKEWEALGQLRRRIQKREGTW